jgi:peptidoglycan/LPS O-acetylase OafA/YrhL
MLYSRFWELAIGSLIVFVPKQNKSEIASFIGLACVLTPVFNYKETMPNPSYFTILPTVGTSLIILFTMSDKIVGRVLSLKPLFSIGLISYSAYLIHQPLFLFARVQSMQPISDSTYMILIFVT